MKTIAFFSNKSGVGNTTLVHHLSWMFHGMGLKVTAVDLDPQSQLTTRFLSRERQYEIWARDTDRFTILGPFRAVVSRERRDYEPSLEGGVNGPVLVPGDLELSTFEDRLATAWIDCLSPDEELVNESLRVTTAVRDVLDSVVRIRPLDLALLDLGPGLNALNRSAVLTS